MIDDTICGYCGVGHPGMTCSEARKADWRDLIYPADLQLQPSKNNIVYCSKCGMEHLGGSSSCGCIEE